ncbi:hypothetical protein C8046_14445 [Serinibacter arcticus]|uniref:LppM domain-containing protein n=1 Tax=Serinibacter arcticus TaxID=1655435 RepID=A0A2U1ZXH2_9MICO|nr:hypothetical protein [Serinibacter arcticus]PWD51664.1 hypothetical protein C8046_14445 [Serinibacter arcticus]
MHRRWKQAVVAGALALLTLTGCVRTEADLEVARDDTITGTIQIVAPLADDSDASRQAVADQVTLIESRALPGLRDLPGVTASAVTPEPGWYGTELSLDGVPIAWVLLGTTPLVTRDGDDFVVAGTIDPAAQPETPIPAVEGERPAGAAESSVSLSLTFPGNVEDVRGSEDLAVVDGRTVTWQTTYDVPVTLDATASATSSAFPDWIWKALVYGVGGVVVLAIAGLITVAVRSRHDG